MTNDMTDHPLSIYFEYADRICEVHGKDAEELSKAINGMAAQLQNRGMNPFAVNPVPWTTTQKTDPFEKVVRLKVDRAPEVKVEVEDVWFEDDEAPTPTRQKPGSAIYGPGPNNPPRVGTITKLDENKTR